MIPLDSSPTIMGSVVASFGELRYVLDLSSRRQSQQKAVFLQNVNWLTKIVTVKLQYLLQEFFF